MLNLALNLALNLLHLLLLSVTFSLVLLVLLHFKDKVSLEQAPLLMLEHKAPLAILTIPRLS